MMGRDRDQVHTLMAASATRASIYSTTIGVSNYHRLVRARMLVPLFMAAVP